VGGLVVSVARAPGPGWAAERAGRGRAGQPRRLPVPMCLGVTGDAGGPRPGAAGVSRGTGRHGRHGIHVDFFLKFCNW